MEDTFINSMHNLKDLHFYLENFSRLLEVEIDQLRYKLEHVDETDGLFQEMLERYKKDYYSVLSKDICQIIDQIRTAHFEYLDGFIESIERYGRVWYSDENGKLEEKSIN